MGIIQKHEKGGKITFAPTKLSPGKMGQIEEELSEYKPTEDEKKVRAMIIKHFTLGYATMEKPRVEFNDLSVRQRDQIDQLSFNTYQSNNGDSLPGDVINAWKSRAMRPIVRNKCISIAAHATARLIFPKVFARDSGNNEQREAAQVMRDLMEYAADQSDYGHYSLLRTITAMFSPASIGYTEYCETYRTVKEIQPDGSWKQARVIDPVFSGFQDKVVPVDQLYIENFYEPDIQKQAWLIKREVYSYSLAETKYNGKYENFKYVRPGVQIIYNDANQSFYQVYDLMMRGEDVEEIVYWNRANDLKIIMVNGVMLTPHDNPNPRCDKMYPFDKYGYEVINNRCFYYKSLAFKLGPDANIVNTLYPMIIDGTYLNLMPPMINRGGEKIGSNVIVPGMVTTLSSPEANLEPVRLSENLKQGLETLFKVEESVSASSEDPLQSGQDTPGSQTAYEISRMEQNASTVLGLFIKMISKHVKDFGKLRIGDILQYMTVADIDELEEGKPLSYKSFLLHDKLGNGKQKTKKIMFDGGLPDDAMSEEAMLELSADTVEMQGGIKSDMELYRVNPAIFRELEFMTMLSPDILNPKSEDLERAYDVETYDKLIQNPIADQEEALRTFLLSTNPKSRSNPDKFIKKPEPQMPMQMQQPEQKKSPKKPSLPQVPSTGQASMV